jgi:PadR family transcriptional regulator PadR
MYDLAGFQRDLLYVAAEQDEPHAVAITDELEQYYDSDIHYGRLYPNLDTLVEKSQIDRRTNSSEVTQRGRREINARREWEEQYVATETEA